MQKIPPVNNNIDDLDPNFRKKFDARRYEVKSKYPNAIVYETRRSQERQNWLYASGRTRKGPIITRTLTSNHFTGKAVDIVFLNNGNIEWVGPYGDITKMALKYGINSLAPKEICHFEDNGAPAIINPFINYTTEDQNNVNKLKTDLLWSGEIGDLSPRVLVLIARVYKALKK